MAGGTRNGNNKSIKDLLTQQKPATKTSVSSQDSENTKLLNAIYSKLEELANGLAEVKKEIAGIKTLVKDIVEEEFVIREKKWNSERESMEKRIEEIEKREELRSRAEIKNNIVIKGYVANSANLNQELSALLEDKLKVAVNVLKVHEIKTAKGGNLFIAKLANFAEKLKVMNNKSKLKGEDLYISNDRTIGERDIQRQLYKMADEERNLGKEVKVGFKKITVNGISSIWKDGIGLITVNTSAGTPPSSSFRQNSAA